MKELNTHQCSLCGKCPAKHGVIVPNPLESYPLCEDCFLWSIAFDHLIDEINHHRHSDDDVREAANILLAELGKRCQAQVVNEYRQTFIEAGVRF